MNVIRIALSVFILALIVLSSAGWVWWGTQAATLLALVAARTVLTVGIAAGVAGLVALWRIKLRHA